MMDTRRRFAIRITARFLALAGLAVGAATTPAPVAAEPAGDVTFTRDIAPILQRSCQRCHRPNGFGPMSLVTYQEVRPWARSIKMRTGLGPRSGVMPPWFVEKDIGIQEFKDDISLGDEEIAAIARWVDSGAPQGDPADMPPLLDFEGLDEDWQMGEPDLVVRSPDVVVPAVGPDTWGFLGEVPIGLAEDRYLAAVEMREINDIPAEVPGDGSKRTVGGRWVFHHMDYSVGDTRFLHNVGSNMETVDRGVLLTPYSTVSFNNYHMHPNGRETRSHLELGLKFHPKGYAPPARHRETRVSLANAMDIDIKPDTAGQELHAFGTLGEHTKLLGFSPHMHAPGVRMCLEAIWGYMAQTLSCVGYDHSWVRMYQYADDAAPLLPKGTILHAVGIIDTTAANRNVADPRNWSGGGRRSISNMFIASTDAVVLTDEEFAAEMAARRARMKSRNDFDIGCPLCWLELPVEQAAATLEQQEGNEQ